MTITGTGKGQGVSNMVAAGLRVTWRFLANNWGRLVVTAYVLFVVSGIAVLGGRSTHQINGEVFVDWMEEKKDIVIKANPGGVWTWAYEYVKGPAMIKIEAVEVEDSGKKKDALWKYGPSNQCTADGDLRSMVNIQNCILPGAPVGALIAKIGGGTAGTKDGKLFVVGRMSIIEIDQNTSGPILLTMNDELTAMANHDGSIKVTIRLKRLEIPPPQPQIPGQSAGPLSNAPPAPDASVNSSAPVKSAPVGPIADKK